MKCPWNKDLLTAQRDQLVNRYLPEAQTGVGIFVVGWYPPELWAQGDYRRSRLKAPTAVHLMEVLSEQAIELSAAGLSIKTVVMTVPRPSPTEPLSRV